MPICPIFPHSAEKINQYLYIEIVPIKVTRHLHAHAHQEPPAQLATIPQFLSVLGTVFTCTSRFFLPF
ncbi:hypothetical protein E2C01_060827 [Portunus trituberculatus]|uniref:Uncharacterized protein n=1 Tax=Portunus trituberculatus TaxID=210409 RepID=A0A5B7H9S0_PORTR|nr:hypothetical protein [Portunus trituberculatus]